jgi:hypothetical protein
VSGPVCRGTARPLVEYGDRGRARALTMRSGRTSRALALLLLQLSAGTLSPGTVTGGGPVHLTCSVPGHDAAGMHAQVAVAPG